MAGKRQKKAPSAQAIGFEKRIYRVLSGDLYISASPRKGEDKGKVADSFVQRYARLIGFVPNNTDDAEDITKDGASLQSYLDQAAGAEHSGSKVKYQGQFELVTMEVFPNSNMAKYYRSLQADLAAVEEGDIDLLQFPRKKYKKPGEQHVINVLEFLHCKNKKKVRHGAVEKEYTGRGNNWGTLDIYLSAISETCKFFDAGPFSRKGGLATKIKKWEKDHKPKQAPSFDAPRDLPMIIESIAAVFTPIRERPPSVVLSSGW